MAWMDDLRRAKAELDAQLAESLNYYTPPNLRPLLGMAAEANPVVSAERAGTAARGVFGEGYSPMQRVGYAGDMLSNMAGIAAPAMVANRAGMPAAQAIEEGLLGFSQAAGVPQFIADESGALRLFHGSPHDFPPVRLIEMPDGTRLYQNMNEMAVTPQGARVLKEYPLGRFDMSKIGTGEGAQAYGHGLYFAESEGVARSYRDGLSKAVNVNGVDVRYGASAADEVENAIRAAGLPSHIAENARWYINRGFTPEQYAADLANDDPEAAKIVAGILKSSDNPGRMYEVNVNANPEDFLDWDKPLSEQPQRVREWFDSRGISPGFAGNQSGAELMQAENSLLGPEGVAAAMREAGVPGIKYLDHGSRFNAMDGVGPQTNTRNYVIFDENLISIVRKYGFAGAAALLGMSEGDLVSAANAQGIDTGTGQQMASPPPRYSVDDIEAMMNGR